MASTYTDGLAVEIIGSGDKAGSWGDVTNNNLKALEEGISRYAEIGAAGSNTSTLNIPDGQTAYTDDSKGRSAVIKWTGAIASGSHHTVTLQVGAATATQARFTAINGLDSTHTLRITTATMDAGDGYVEIPNGYSAEIHINNTTDPAKSQVVNSLVNLSIDKLALGNQEVISNTVDDRVDITSSTLQIGDGSGDVIIQSDGTGSANRDLVLRNSSTNTGLIRINDAANGDIEITPDGSGKVVMDKVNIGGGEIDGTPIGANSANTGVFTSATVDDIVLNGKVITMTGSTGDTATLTAGTNGTLDIATTDAAGTAANIQITADGTAELAGTTVTLDASSNITLDADGGTITFADGGSSLGTITSSGWSGNAATVTTNANLTGEVTSSGNATTIANNVVDEANLKVSNSPTNDYVLAADNTVTGGLKWAALTTGDITGVTAGTNLNGGGSSGDVTINLDSTISGVTSLSSTGALSLSSASDLLTLTANSSSITLKSASSGGVNTLSGENTKVVLNTDSTNSNGNLLIGQGTGTATVKPGGTGRLNISSSSTATSQGAEAININASAGRIGLEVGQDSDHVSVRIPISSDPTNPVLQAMFNDEGLMIHEAGGGYINFSSTTGSTGNGFKAGGSNDPVEFKAKRDAASNNDTWGRIYHSGMASGDGAYFESSTAYTGAATYTFDISSLSISSGSNPSLVQVFLKRTDASSDVGYDQNDFIQVGSKTLYTNTSSGTMIWSSNTYVKVLVANRIDVLNGSTGAENTLSSAGGWSFVVKAWK